MKALLPAGIQNRDLKASRPIDCVTELQYSQIIKAQKLRCSTGVLNEIDFIAYLLLVSI